MDTPSEGALLIQGQGTAGTDEIYIGMKAEEDALAPYYNWALYGLTNHESTELIADQPGANTIVPRYISDIGSMEYWIMATGRYFHLTTKIGTVYTSMHMGLILPYGAPAEYAYPLIVMGNIGRNEHYTLSNNDFRQCYDPGEDACVLRDPGGTWLLVENNNGSVQTDRVVWPYCNMSTTWPATIGD